MSFKVKTNVCKHLPSNKDDHSKRLHSQNIPCKLSSSEISGLIQCCDVDAVVNKTCGTDNLFCVQWLLTYYWSVATWPSVVVLFKRFWWIILFVFVISSKLQCWHIRFHATFGVVPITQYENHNQTTQKYSVIMQGAEKNWPVACQETAAFYTAGNQVTFKAILLLQIFLIRLYLYTERKGENWGM